MVQALAAAHGSALMGSPVWGHFPGALPPALSPPVLPTAPEEGQGLFAAPYKPGSPACSAAFVSWGSEACSDICVLSVKLGLGHVRFTLEFILLRATDGEVLVLGELIDPVVSEREGCRFF